MKFKYCKNNCLEKTDYITSLYRYYECNCNEGKLLIKKSLFTTNNEFRISGISIYNKATNNKLFLFKILYTNVIQINLNNDFIFDLDLNYMLYDQYILDKVISYWENIIFK